MPKPEIKVEEQLAKLLFLIHFIAPLNFRRNPVDSAPGVSLSSYHLSIAIGPPWFQVFSSFP